MSYKISDTAMIIESDGETILIARSMQFDNTITILDSDYTLSSDYISNYFPPTNPFQGNVSGYVVAGQTTNTGSTGQNVIEKFPFSSDANSADVGDLSFGRNGAGASSTTHGYWAGGATRVNVPPYRSEVIDKFPFSVDANATDVGDLYNDIEGNTGASSSTHGYSISGSPYPALNTIAKYSFSVDGNSTDVGDLQSFRLVHGHSTADQGFASSGYSPSAGAKVKTIDKFPFASDANATDHGEAFFEISSAGAHSSDVSGYLAGGQGPAGPTNEKLIQKFPFSSTAGSSNVGDLAAIAHQRQGQSSRTHGYTEGGRVGPPSRLNSIEKFPFATDASATDVGDLTSARSLSSVGCQI